MTRCLDCTKMSTFLYFSGKMDDNPWLVPNLDEFLFYNCPECSLKTKEHDTFFKHAVSLHPKAKVLELQKIDIKEEIEEIEGWKME